MISLESILEKVSNNFIRLYKSTSEENNGNSIETTQVTLHLVKSSTPILFISLVKKKQQQQSIHTINASLTSFCRNLIGKNLKLLPVIKKLAGRVERGIAHLFGNPSQLRLDFRRSLEFGYPPREDTAGRVSDRLCL